MCMHKHISNTWWLWLLVAAFCAWDMSSSFRFPGHPSTGWVLDKMFSGQLSVTSRPVFFREMWMVDCSCTGKQSTGYRLMAMLCNYKQWCTDGFRCAWRLSCSSWTWRLVSIAKMVGLPHVFVLLTFNSVIMWVHVLMHYFHISKAVWWPLSCGEWVLFLWGGWLNQVSTQIWIFGEVVYYFSTQI